MGRRREGWHSGVITRQRFLQNIRAVGQSPFECLVSASRTRPHTRTQNGGVKHTLSRCGENRGPMRAANEEASLAGNLQELRPKMPMEVGDESLPQGATHQ